VRKLVMVLALVTTTAQAATWVEYARDTSDTRHEYEPTLITHRNVYGAVLQVWTQSHHAAAQAQTRYDIHCASRSYRITNQFRTAPGSTYSLDDPGARWHSAIPGGVEMALIDTVCTRYK
jgi:hypothetical protein